MNRISCCALVLLACVVAVNCDSNPTNPDPGGGGGGGGGGGTGAVAQVTDEAFDDGTWDEVLDIGGAGGTGGAGHVSYNGQVGADIRRINITVNGGGQVAVFSIKRRIGYLPARDGRILSIYKPHETIPLRRGGKGPESTAARTQNREDYMIGPGAE